MDTQKIKDDLIKEINKSYILFTRKSFYYFLGGAFAVMVGAGIISYRSIWHAVKTISSTPAYKKIDSLSKVADTVVKKLKKNENVFEKATSNINLFLTGTIIPFAGETSNIPDGWLLCDGSLKQKDKYSALYSIIKGYWGKETSDKFRLPDLRGMFLRGVDMNGNRDQDKNRRYALYPKGHTGNQVGSYQSDAFKRHTHRLAIADGANPGLAKLPPGDHSYNQITMGTGDTIREQPAKTGANETRPKNAYVYYIIKY